MPPRYLRLIFFSEFLVAVVAVFTAWSEIGGQAALDIMPWAWKGGLGIGLALALSAYAAALATNDSIWNARTSRWLALVLLLVLAIGVVTYYYVLQVESEPTEEQDNSSATGLRSRIIAEPQLRSSLHRNFV